MSFQTDPALGEFTVRFNGAQVHQACRGYLEAGTLPLPLNRYVTTSGFRGVADQVLSYRMAGSFVLHLTERFGLPDVLRFFQTNDRNEGLDAIRTRFRNVFGASLEDAEGSWIAALREVSRADSQGRLSCCRLLFVPIPVRKMTSPATTSSTDRRVVSPGPNLAGRKNPHRLRKNCGSNCETGRRPCQVLRIDDQ